MMRFVVRKMIASIGLLLAIMLAGKSYASVSRESTNWEKLVAEASGRLDMELYQSTKYGGGAPKGEAFFRAEAECSANSNALLSANGILVSAPAALHLGSAAAWSGKTAVYVRLDFVNGDKYRFICLIGHDDKLERTRLLDINSRARKSAVEIENSYYIYGGK
ncbi:MAG TPA: hypothetical protein VME63_03585 [Dyella sp.]|uniref:hypothetical protein n=1 Tax=Dyella sp. TaxID=1869338 RepID=UPI002C452A70|nr:hypothetical protein [Dyella sp.]HTV84457.1 hypothetical protein [Dyella sp.]